MCEPEGRPNERDVAEAALFYPEERDRLDRFLSGVSDLSRNQVQRLIRERAVLVNGAPSRVNQLVAAGDVVQLYRPAPVEMDVVPQDIPLDIVYEDDDICVVNKPQGLGVHPRARSPGRHAGQCVVVSLWDAFCRRRHVSAGYCAQNRSHDFRPVGGCQNDAAHLSLAEQFRDHTAGRSYVALVDGNLREDEGTVTGPIGRHHSDRKRMAVTPEGRPAVTHWKVLARFSSHTLLRICLETGRTHQIRVHMAYIHHPVTGDEVYGGAKKTAGSGRAGAARLSPAFAASHITCGAGVPCAAACILYLCPAETGLGWRSRICEGALATMRLRDIPRLACLFGLLLCCVACADVGNGNLNVADASMPNTMSTATPVPTPQPTPVPPPSETEIEAAFLEILCSIPVEVDLAEHAI